MASGDDVINIVSVGKALRIITEGKTFGLMPESYNFEKEENLIRIVVSGMNPYLFIFRDNEIDEIVFDKKKDLAHLDFKGNRLFESLKAEYHVGFINIYLDEEDGINKENKC